MIRQYLTSLVITVGIFYSPYLFHVTPELFWVKSSALSLTYICLIYFLCKTPITPCLIAIEFFAMLFNVMACIEFNHMSPESQLLNDHYDAIMSYCYALELLFIMGGATGGGFKRIYYRWLRHNSRDQSDHRTPHISESHLCMDQ